MGGGVRQNKNFRAGSWKNYRENGCLITVLAIILNERGLEPSAGNMYQVSSSAVRIANAATNVAPFGVKDESQECVDITIFNFFTLSPYFINRQQLNQY